MVGLDAAGKTTILYKLKLGEGESCFLGHWDRRARQQDPPSHFCQPLLPPLILTQRFLFRPSCFRNQSVVTTIPTIGKSLLVSDLHLSSIFV